MKPAIKDNWAAVYSVDALTGLQEMPEKSVHCAVTSPPYWGLRSYLPSEHPDKAMELGAEPTPELYVERLVEVFRALRRVLRDDGTLWLNLGSSYAGSWGNQGRKEDRGSQRPINGPMIQNLEPYPETTSRTGSWANEHPQFKPKDLVPIPWMVAMALQRDGWYLRSDIIWQKPNPMPESVTDRPTCSHEYMFLLTKSPRYYFDQEAVREKGAESTGWAKSHAEKPTPNGEGNGELAQSTRMGNGISGRNIRSVWNIATRPYSGWVETVRQVPVVKDDADGDTKRITSPGCPAHGDRAALPPTDLRGVRASDNPSRTRHNDSHPAQEQPLDSAPTGPMSGADSEVESSDSPLRECSPSATSRSNENHRTDLAPETSSLDTPSAQTNSHTGDKSTLPELFEQDHGTSENRNELSDSSAHPSLGIRVGTVRKSSTSALPASGPPAECTCEFYKEITEKTSHYATFPPDLIYPCIKAGTSERGVCGACGAPWERVVERGEPARDWRETDTPRTMPNGNSVRSEGLPPNVQEQSRPSRTVGWQPTCSCNGEYIKEPYEVSRTNKETGEPETFIRYRSVYVPGIPLSGHPIAPATVLDPFMGSGTTALAARKLGRRSIGFDLDERNVKQIEERLGWQGVMF